MGAEHGQHRRQVACPHVAAVVERRGVRVFPFASDQRPGVVDPHVLQRLAGDRDGLVGDRRRQSGHPQIGFAGGTLGLQAEQVGLDSGCVGAVNRHRSVMSPLMGPRASRCVPWASAPGDVAVVFPVGRPVGLVLPAPAAGPCGVGRRSSRWEVRLGGGWWRASPGGRPRRRFVRSRRAVAGVPGRAWRISAVVRHVIFLG